MFLDAVLVYNFLLNEPHERIRAVAVKETAELLSVSETTLFLWNRDKKLENKKIGNRVYYLKSEVICKLNSVA